MPTGYGMIGLMKGSTRYATAAVEAVLCLAAPRQRMVDDHMFRARTATGHESTFRLQLFTAPGTRTVAVATQTAGEGMFLANGAERFAAAVWERHFPADSQPPVWIQRQLRDMTTHFPEVFQLVIFAGVHPYRLSQPGWATITPEQLEDLVGLPVATDRGTGYTPPPAEPEPQVSFEVTAVRRLARPRPFRDRLHALGHPLVAPVGTPGTSPARLPYLLLVPRRGLAPGQRHGTGGPRTRTRRRR